MKEVMKDLGARYEAIFNGGSGDVVNDFVQCVPLSEGQYYRIDKIEFYITEVAISPQVGEGVVRRSSSWFAVGETGIEVNSSPLTIMRNIIAMSMGGLSVDITTPIVINQSSASVSIFNNPLVNHDTKGEKALERVLSGRETFQPVVLAVGDMTGFVAIVDITYAIVVLSDSERIAVLSRCKC